MGFNRDLSIIAQNAGTTAAAIYNQLVANRGNDTFNEDEYNAIREVVFQGTLELAGVETVIETFEGGDLAPTPASVTGYASSGGSRPHADTELRFGKYRGKTLQEVYESGADGVSWLEWARDNATNDFIKQAIRKFLAA